MYSIVEYVNLKVPLLKQFDKMYFYVANWTDWRLINCFISNEKSRIIGTLI